MPKRKVLPIIPGDDAGDRRSRDLDPIFKLIAHHRRARRVWGAMLGKIGEAETKFHRETGEASPAVVCFVREPKLYLSRGGSTPEELLANAKLLPERTIAQTARSHKEIDELLDSDPRQAKRVHAELDRRIKLYNATVGAVEALAETQYAEVEGAEKKLFKTRARTLSGLMALFRYAEETDRKGIHVWEADEDAWRFLNAAARSVCTLAGLPVPATLG
jgi:hypothetical protein